MYPAVHPLAKLFQNIESKMIETHEHKGEFKEW
jgi:hypothetical protein